MHRLLSLTFLATASLFAQQGLVRITHGPILGHVGATEMWIWARTSTPAEIRAVAGLTAGSLNLSSPPVRTSLDHDNTGWMHLTGLRPNTKYFYRVLSANDATVVASFLTLPSADDHRHPELNPRGLYNFRFQFGSCADQRPTGTNSGPELPAYRTMLRELKDRVHFSIIDGDWLYEDKRDFTVDDWRAQNNVARNTPLPRILEIAPAITGVWENYKIFLERGSALAAWHREIPSYYTPDDHEILNDIYGTGTPGRRDRRTVFRDIGIQAWFDYLSGSQPVAFHQPVHFGQARLQRGSDILTDAAADFTRIDLAQAGNLHVHWGGQFAGVDNDRSDRVGAGDPNAGVYAISQIVDKNRLRIRPAAPADSTASYSIGRSSFGKFRVGNAEFYMLDTRSERDMHDTANPRAAGTSILGNRQREWLRREMAASDADFFFLASTVNLTIPHVAGPSTQVIPNKDDAWTAFLSEREEMIKFWDSLGKPVFLMTGDLHNSFAIKVTDRVWEFASGPLGSQNHGARSEGGRPSNGPFDSRGRQVEIRWSTHIKDDIPPTLRKMPFYAVAQVNNVYDNPVKPGEHRWIAFPRPHVVISYYDGRTGDLLYAEPVHAGKLGGPVK
jgi:phosphodiesterase/alkaline phosphatase D-like protein